MNSINVDCFFEVFLNYINIHRTEGNIYFQYEYFAATFNHLQRNGINYSHSFVAVFVTEICSSILQQ